MPGCRGSSQVLDRSYLGKSYIASHCLRLQRPRGTDAVNKKSKTWKSGWGSGQSLNQVVLRLRDQDRSKGDKQMRNSHSIFDSFQFIYKRLSTLGLGRVIDLLDFYKPIACDRSPLKIIPKLNFVKKSHLHTFSKENTFQSLRNQPRDLLLL